jgi:putative heme-binding domain-containing protein
MMTPFLLAISFAASPPNLGLSLPPGFQATLVAGDDLVHDAFVMAVHPKGHVLVGGRGFLKVLVDADGDGKAESANTILEKPDLFPMGLWWSEKELLFVSDRGVQSLPMDGLKPTGPPTLVLPVKARGEHDAHAVKRGPDGWLYLMCGNMAGVDESWASDVNSPVKKPVAGCLVRISPDGKRRQVVADGFRNAFDFDWNAAGDPFTYDSDNERCVSLPWYEGCRFYHVVAGANHGWLSPQQGEFWRKPPYWFDVAEPLADLGRGSPTGVVCYKHTAFPPKYRDGFFLLDWTFGKIHFASLTQSGASYDAKVEVFAKPIGDEGFAPVGAAVHPVNGDLLVAIGGRGTKGAVYRIRYVGSKVGWDDAASPTTNATSSPPKAFMTGYYTDVRRRLEQSFLDSTSVIDQAAKRGNGGIWTEATFGSSRLINKFALRNRPSRPLAHRWSFADFARQINTQYFAGVSSKRGSVFEGYALKIATTSLPKSEWEKRRKTSLFIQGTGNPARIEPGHPNYWTELGELKRCASYAFDLPANHRRDYWSDLVATGSLESWSARWLDELAAENSVPELVHTLICLARCPLPEGCEPELAAALLSLDEKLEKSKAATDRNWPLRIGELHQAIAARWPKVDEEMARHPSFGRPAHVLFAMGKSFEGQRPQAASRTMEVMKREPDTDWSPDVVKLLRGLPVEQVRPTMVELWERRGLRDELTAFFAAHPTEGDAGRFVESLNSPRIETVEKALKGLETLAKDGVKFADVGSTVGELLAAAERSATASNGTPHRLASSPPPPQGGRFLDARKAEGSRKGSQATVTERAIKLAAMLAGRPNAGRDELVAWLKANHPSAHAKLSRGGVDWPGFQQRMAKVDWSAGDPAKGKAYYEKAGCAVCHAGSGLGPDLKGVAARFSREDLFRSIVDPNKDVSDRYRTTQVVTKSGAVQVGLVVYESADGVLLQTAPSTMIRIPGNDIEEQRLQRTSIMPTGLLDKATDMELADLMAYLRTR